MNEPQHSDNLDNDSPIAAPDLSEFALIDPVDDLSTAHLPLREMFGAHTEQVQAFGQHFAAISAEIGKVVVGMEEVVKLSLASFFSDGHVLLEGAPGLAKTRLANALATALGLETNRVQFTPDLLPSDITGSPMLEPDTHVFSFREGPLFTQVLLADEINRTPPKTQSALLEGMAEGQVTSDGRSYPLPQHFFVIATQNPKESQGVYPLAEAQLDRFAVKIQVGFPSKNHLKEIGRRTTGAQSQVVEPVFSAETAASDIQQMKDLVRSVVVSPEAEDFLATVMCTLHPGHPDGIEAEKISKSVDEGPSPRGYQATLMLAKVQALLEGRNFVEIDDISQAAAPALAHRLSLTLDSQWGKKATKPATLVQAAVDAVKTSVSARQGDK